MKKVFIAILSVCLAVTLISCGSTKVEEKTASTGDWISCIKEGAELHNGCFYTTDDLGQFSSLEVELKKDSGYEGSCFGLIFGFTDPKDGTLKNFTRFEINILGEYALYTWNGSEYTDLIDDSAKNTAYLVENVSISKEYGASNKLKIERNDDGTCNCYINGTKIASNKKVMDSSNYNVRAFFSVGKAGEEKLPDVPVQVSYKISNSTVYKAKK